MKTVLLHFTKSEEAYLPVVKQLIASKLTVKLSNVVTAAGAAGYYELVVAAKNKGCSAVATTSPRVLASLLGLKKTDELPSTDDYAGSIIEKAGIEFLILHPLEQLMTVPHGRFLAARYWKKFIEPDSFLQLPEFEWELFAASLDASSLLEDFENATIMSVDIETAPDDFGIITCCGFTGVWLDTKSAVYRTRTVVIPFTSDYNVAVCRHLAGNRVPKVLQNGQYDIAHLFRYNILLHNYLFDTLFLFHCWYAELPKGLASIVAFCLRKWQYWKDESKTLDLLTYYQYNAKDCFTTAMSLLALLREICQEREATVLLATHDAQAAAFADRTLEIRDGRLQEHRPDYLAEPMSPMPPRAVQ